MPEKSTKEMSEGSAPIKPKNRVLDCAVTNPLLYDQRKFWHTLYQQDKCNEDLVKRAEAALEVLRTHKEYDPNIVIRADTNDTQFYLFDSVMREVGKMPAKDAEDFKAALNAAKLKK